MFSFRRIGEACTLWFQQLKFMYAGMYIEKVHRKPLFTSEGRETISAAVQLVYIFCYVISAMMLHFKSLNMPHKSNFWSGSSEVILYWDCISCVHFVWVSISTRSFSHPYAVCYQTRAGYATRMFAASANAVHWHCVSWFYYSYVSFWIANYVSFSIHSLMSMSLYANKLL